MLKIVLEILALIAAFLGIQVLTVWLVMRHKRKQMRDQQHPKS